MPKKIYELANELSMGALDLVEKLRGQGFSIRNHMSVLGDEDLKKITSLLEKDSGKKASGSTKKKKVVRARTKSQTADKATPASPTKPVEKVSEPAKESASLKGKPAATGVRKKIVTVKRKPGEAGTPRGRREESPSRKDYMDDRPKGLRVVYRPAPKPEPVPVEAPRETAPAAESEDSKKVYLKEKMHTFTPVYIPPKKEAVPPKERPSVRPPRLDRPDSTSTEVKPPGTEGPEKRESRKRMGDLAAMVAKPKSGKGRDMIQMRADEELRSYSSSVGVSVQSQNNYTPVGRKKSYLGPKKQTTLTEVKDSKRVVGLHDGCTAAELAQKLKIRFEELRDKSLDMNLLMNSTDFIGVELASEIAALYSYRVENKAFNEEKVIKKGKKSNEAERAPVVTVMGHVDHGKTTLLDSLRKTKVVDGEAGGITQHIGAYQVPVRERWVTFLDTPGHAAFSNIRERGTQITDIVVLVVAADDGVMPQTKESILFCKANNVPIVVAINKMDKEGAKPERIKQELMEFKLTPEEWGGETQFVEISALKGEGVDKLLESLIVQTEIMELKGTSTGTAEGTIIESRIEAGRGPVSTVLVQRGTLKQGDVILVGETFGRARSLMNYNGEKIKSAGPSMPVQILGLIGAPQPGDSLNTVKNEREAKKVIAHRLEAKLKKDSVQKKHVSLEEFFGAEKKEGEQKSLKLIIRSDVMSSYEAIKGSLEALGNEEINVQIIGGGTGAITDSDVRMADSMDAIIFGFNMRPVTSAQRLVESLGIDVKTYAVIYDLIDDVTKALEGMLEPERIEKYLGRVEVKDVFNIPKVGVIAGGHVVDGKVERGCQVRLLRDGKILFDGKLSTLKRFKDDVKEVRNGLDCGISLENYNNIKIKDLFEAYNLELRERKLSEFGAESGQR